MKISGVSLEHIPKSLSPTGHIDSAPKDFTVWVSCIISHIAVVQGVIMADRLSQKTFFGDCSSNYLLGY